MNKFLHKLSFTSFKKLSFLFIFLILSWHVYAGNENSFQDSTQLKIVKCYPNPATSIINFEFRKNVDKTSMLQIFSFVGKQMLETPVSDNKITVTLNDFYRGIYVFQLRDKSGKIVESGKFQVIK